MIRLYSCKCSFLIMNLTLMIFYGCRLRPNHVNLVSSSFFVIFSHLVRSRLSILWRVEIVDGVLNPTQVVAEQLIVFS